LSRGITNVARFTRHRLLVSLLVIALFGVVGYRWVLSTIGRPIPWPAFFELADGASQAEVLAVLGPPSEVGDNYARWDGSNGSGLIQFDRTGRIVGCGKVVDAQAGIKRVWRKLCLPREWLPYVVELRRP
jgi:hypothetical protein